MSVAAALAYAKTKGLITAPLQNGTKPQRSAQTPAGIGSDHGSVKPAPLPDPILGSSSREKPAAASLVPLPDPSAFLPSSAPLSDPSAFSPSRPKQASGDKTAPFTPPHVVKVPHPDTPQQPPIPQFLQKDPSKLFSPMKYHHSDELESPTEKDTKKLIAKKLEEKPRHTVIRGYHESPQKDVQKIKAGLVQPDPVHNVYRLHNSRGEERQWGVHCVPLSDGSMRGRLFPIKDDGSRFIPLTGAQCKEELDKLRKSPSPRSFSEHLKENVKVVPSKRKSPSSTSGDDDSSSSSLLTAPPLSAPPPAPALQTTLPPLLPSTSPLVDEEALALPPLLKETDEEEDSRVKRARRMPGPLFELPVLPSE